MHRGQLLTHPEGHKNAEGVWINELRLHVSAAYKYTHTHAHKHALIIMYKYKHFYSHYLCCKYKHALHTLHTQTEQVVLERLSKRYGKCNPTPNHSFMTSDP